MLSHAIFPCFPCFPCFLDIIKSNIYWKIPCFPCFPCFHFYKFPCFPCFPWFSMVLYFMISHAFHAFWILFKSNIMEIPCFPCFPCFRFCKFPCFPWFSMVFYSMLSMLSWGVILKFLLSHASMESMGISP